MDGLLNFFSMFTDPISRASCIAALLIALSCSLLGTLLVVGRRALLADTVTHASYPAVLVGLLIEDYFSEELRFLAVLICSLILGWLMLRGMESCSKKGIWPKDSLLCFGLAFFFSIGILITSVLQRSNSAVFLKAKLLFFGQITTLTDHQLIPIALSTLLIIATLWILYPAIKISLFDPIFGKTSGIKIGIPNRIIDLLLCLAIIGGIPLCGIVLLSGLFIIPPLIAKNLSHRLSTILILAAIFGVLGTSFGSWIAYHFETSKTPTGPAIILFLTGLFYATFLFSPRFGWIATKWRQIHFHFQKTQENILKALWQGHTHGLTLLELQKIIHHSSKTSLPFIWLKALLYYLHQHGWVQYYDRDKKTYRLTEDGHAKATSLVRKHRLWELYLVESLGQNANEVHPWAEEIEHVMSGEFERALSTFLSDPANDPHEKPIPPPPL
jgi:manganese/zinc/iron transport system permease protein